MKSEYDVIVAGGGIAGSLAGAAAAMNGAKCVIIDRNDYSAIGKKTNWGWVCGDAVAKSHIDFIHEKIGISISEPEIVQKVKGVYVLSPDLERRFLFEGEGYTLDRPKLAKKLIDFAMKNGAEYLPLYEVEGPIFEGNKVAGVFGRNEKNERFEMKAKVVIDALGIATTLRRRLPENEYIERNVSIEDIESTGRYIINFAENVKDENYYDPENALIHLNQVLAPGGYGWVFPKGKNRVNVGVGVEKNSLEIRNKKLGKSDNLHSLIDEYVRWNKAIGDYSIDQQDNNGKGYWSVAVRRQFESIVYYGYMGAGDSMVMPNPISAGGIGPAMVSGVIAGEVAASASANGATFEELWKYNVEYNKVYGNKTAALEAFRVYLQSLNNDLLNYGMKNFITEEEAVVISYGRIPELSLTKKVEKLIHGVGNINAFRNLLYVLNVMKELNSLYARYPSNYKDFVSWKESVRKVIKDVKERFRPNPV
ncbi:MAG: FAD-dependent oxidoreductase [Candidatus Micrarchaeaceae archaeon]